MGLPDADELLLKAHIMHAINSEIKRRKLTQAVAGKLVGLAQPDLSRIANGRGSGFSTERLFAALRNLGCDIEIVISQANGPIGALRLRQLAG
ncbi:MAG: XRE family transcriptional regulator [Candidatus Eremiobacteraeota bacterium]|nr:XRE family transcriptional regulator [Candidatus Eremiobacteraeota bacterium]MBC5804205.1 XRE family transcriptional regulator [Candidatus Eremiobacteraeota bacterium]MBC5822595.1 XRE family transcriptional regulator [Candidatus Eremiobacteraeota bacterium]